MSSFTLSALAEEDLIQIYVDGATSFGLDQARRYHKKLFRAFRFLAENPLAGSIRPELRAEIRAHPVESHIVLYTLRDQDIFSCAFATPMRIGSITNVRFGKTTGEPKLFNRKP